MANVLVYNLFAMIMGDAKFGLRADLVLQTNLNGSPAKTIYPSMYGATAPSGPWPPHSKSTFILL